MAMNAIAKDRIQAAYSAARDRYAELGVDVEGVLKELERIPVSLNCWQGDDVGGFEHTSENVSGGGIQVTGSYPGKARTIHELQRDVEKALSLIPGQHRLNLHAMYGDFGGKTIDRDAILPEHFRTWIDWGKEKKLKLDFNATCFAHPKADSGYTLSNTAKGIREFWIEHVSRCRTISAFIGREQSDPCIHDLWIPDGSKDITVTRTEHRQHLKDSLDAIFAVRHNPAEMKDALESKLFGIGSESFVVGSLEFYLGYGITNNIMLCMDMGHYHPTESVADKVSSILQFSQELLLHASRGVRWDSDHVVILGDDLRALAEEIVRGGNLHRIHFALDFFDGSINRIGAWVIGARATLKAVLLALLEPRASLRTYEEAGNNFARLALLEELKTMPSGAVWDYYCLKKNVPPAAAWIQEVLTYEQSILKERQ